MPFVLVLTLQVSAKAALDLADQTQSFPDTVACHNGKMCGSLIPSHPTELLLGVFALDLIALRA